VKDQELASALAELAGGGRSSATDWREYYHAIRERLWIPLLCLVLGGIGATAYMMRQETRFQARSVLFIEQEQDQVLNGVKNVRTEQITSVDMINTVVDLLRSYPFATRVAERVRLHEDVRFRAGLPDRTSALTAADAGAALFASVNAQYRRNTRLIDVAVTHADPEVAVNVANAYADEYLRYLFEKRTEASKAAHQFLLEEAERLRKKMRVSEEAMQSFRERERAASLETVQQGMQSKLVELAARASDIEQKIFQLETDLKVARAAPANPDELLRLPSVAAEPKVARLSDRQPGARDSPPQPALPRQASRVCRRAHAARIPHRRPQYHARRRGVAARNRPPAPRQPVEGSDPGAERARNPAALGDGKIRRIQRPQARGGNRQRHASVRPRAHQGNRPHQRAHRLTRPRA
jgi:hypothetical protein